VPRLALADGTLAYERGVILAAVPCFLGIVRRWPSVLEAPGP
jgi:hypothetical protein